MNARALSAYALAALLATLTACGGSDEPVEQPTMHIPTPPQCAALGACA